MSRLDYFTHGPEMANQLVRLNEAIVKNKALDDLKDLVTIRASQLNGCTFCVDMHVKEATIKGERALRLHHLVVWHESPLFTDRERAALEWTEALTKIAPHGVSDDTYNRVREHFSEEELTALTFLIVSINGWNRLGVAFRREPGSADKAFGLEKAGLS